MWLQPVGNRVNLTRGRSRSYCYDRADHITMAGTVGYTVNANGNLVARGLDSFTYDQANHLTSATVGRTTSSYVYDGDGKRASKTGGGTTNYISDVNCSLPPVVLYASTRKDVSGLGLAPEDRLPNLRRLPLPACVLAARSRVSA